MKRQIKNINYRRMAYENRCTFSLSVGIEEEVLRGPQNFAKRRKEEKETSTPQKRFGQLRRDVQN